MKWLKEWLGRMKFWNREPSEEEKKLDELARKIETKKNRIVRRTRSLDDLIDNIERNAEDGKVALGRGKR